MVPAEYIDQLEGGGRNNGRKRQGFFSAVKIHQSVRDPLMRSVRGLIVNVKIQMKSPGPPVTSSAEREAVILGSVSIAVVGPVGDRKPRSSSVLRGKKTRFFFAFSPVKSVIPLREHLLYTWLSVITSGRRRLPTVSPTGTVRGSVTPTVRNPSNPSESAC